ncbi:ESX secretion-associated protein EspG [Actinophytocola gossypii]|uniref:ESX secretion-associated protein EspG n=1 Tax=Actinophytocola gossypii TaxID=2812003 RepID=A0ABT2J3B5_9PSEU|nr:ESX secretion-associated protein EspG [Actinophytocola gossypii]MCT2582344.1 ESX secretion-associated protein EspG [Actinophytocola gossypii]
MTTTVAESVQFGLVELDLLATHAGVGFPYPLRVPSFGRVAEDRDSLLATAGYTLRERGLADEHGPTGTAADLVAALREHRGTVDVVVVRPGGATGAVALPHRTGVVVCDQVLDDDLAATVRVRRVPRAALADELTALIPDVPAAPTLPITLPPGVVGDALRLVDQDEAATRQRLRDLVRDQGGDPGVVDQLAGLLPSITGRGQLGATRRTDAGTVRAGTDLSWLDGPQGRVRIDQADDGWTSVNALRPAELRTAITAAAE